MSSPTPPPGSSSTRRRIPLWAVLVLGAVVLVVGVLLAPIVAILAVVALITSIVSLTGSRPTWLRLRSRRAAGWLTAASAVVVLVTGGVTVAAAAGRNTESPQAVGFVARGASAEPTETARPSVDRPSPTPTPRTVVREVTVTEAIPFERTSTEDGAVPRGQTSVTPGADGTRTIVYRVTTVGGAETSREVVSDAVTVAPIAEVTVVGTYDAPAPEAPAPAQASGCDANYTDACVPIASDVDCAGGSGNGPAYLEGTARIVGSDVYDLDRNDDGIACN